MTKLCSFVPLCTLITLFFLPVPAEAQTASRLAALLDKPSITYAEAAAFTLEAAEHGTFTDPNGAFRFAQEQSWLPKRIKPGDTARYNGIALLLMRSFEMKGGALYTVTQNAHYAYRELVRLDIIQGHVDPAKAVSGTEFLFMINQMIELTENRVRIAQETHRTAATGFPHILFSPNQAVLQESEKAKIRDIAKQLENLPRNIIIEGHTALAGTPEAQKSTSILRARAVANYLISLGARTESEITIRGYGAERPVADNMTIDGMAQNRRAEITIGAGR